MIQLSSVMANADRPPNDAELAYAQELIDRMRKNAAALTRLSNEEPDVDMAIASEFALGWLQRLQRELDGEEEGSSRR